MNVIYVDFADHEYKKAKKLVIKQLALWGFREARTIIPRDAIACALDETTYFEDGEKRLLILRKIEESMDTDPSLD